MRPLVLASGSPRRRALLEALGVRVEVRVSEVDEVATGGPEEVVIGNAGAKRRAVAAQAESEDLVVAADTVVVLDGRILGKPADLDEALAMLAELSGRRHEVFTGVSVSVGEKVAEGAEMTEVLFRSLGLDEIRRFVDIVRPLDRAGAYTVDGPGSLLVESYKGCYHNVLGLPIVRLERLLQEIGESLHERMESEKAQFL